MLRSSTDRPGGGAPLRVALLCSHRAPGLERLVGADRPYRLVAAVATDPESSALAPLAAAGVPAVAHDIDRWYRERGAPIGDRAVRREYDRRAAVLLAPFRPDLLVLCAYLYVVTEPLLEPWGGRAINVHDSDLTIAGPDGRPVYRGLHSTRDAIAAGETETRSTVHLVTEEVDVGPPIARSGPFPVPAMIAEARRWGADDIVRAYAYAHREWMMRASWGALLDRAIRAFAEGRVRALGARPAADRAEGSLRAARA